MTIESRDQKIKNIKFPQLSFLSQKEKYYLSNNIEYVKDIFRSKILESEIPTKFIDAHITRLISSVNKPEDSYFIHGDVGVGKTYLMAVLCKLTIFNSIIKGNNHSIRWISIGNALAILKDYYSRGESVGEFKKNLLLTDYLFIDDMGLDKLTEWSLEEIYNLINDRYINERHICLTSNYDLNDLADRIDDRVSSRLHEMCTIIRLKGKDRRLIK